MKKTNRGFTLIELLVVIAIIGILASVILASLNSARSKARDAKRISEIQQIQTALELYYDDHGSYPQCDGQDGCTTTGSGGAPMSHMGLTPTYIPSIDNDPLNQAGQYGYYYARGYTKDGQNYRYVGGNPSNYILVTRLENPKGATFPSFDNGQTNYIVSN